MDKKKEDPLDFKIPREPLSPEQKAEAERLAKLWQAQEERAALQKRDLH